MQGRVWILEFIFTACAGPCPGMSQQMQKLQASLASVPGVGLLTVTVDRVHDTVAVLTARAKALGAQPGRWELLTGKTDMVQRFAVEVDQLQDVPMREKVDSFVLPLLHSTRFVLVDPSGQVRGFYEGTREEEANRVARDAARLAKE
jgi:protein SCO1/2